jgi:uncharacterized protein YjlB
MSLIDDLKRVAEKAIAWGVRKTRKSGSENAKSAPTRSRMTASFPIIPDGHSSSTKVQVSGSPDPAAIFEELFESNDWVDAWRDGIYDWVHYHSRTHEVLGIARGTGRVQFGGSKGRKVILKPSDVAILPAGTGHQRLEASDDFLVVGAYPPTGSYDECTSSEDRKKAQFPFRKPAAEPRPGLWKSGPLLSA